MKTNFAGSNRSGGRVGVILFAVASAATLLLSGRTIPGHEDNAAAHITVLPNPTMPISVRGTDITQDYVKNLSTLSYRVWNTSGAKLRDFVLAVTEFNATGKVLGGEEVTVRADLQPGKSAIFSTELSHFVPSPSDGERVIVAVLRADTADRTWTVAHNEFNSAAANTIGGVPSSLSAQESAPSPDNVVDCSVFCDKCNNSAVTNCTSGIKSYSCGSNSNGTGCTCSYTCK